MAELTVPGLGYIGGFRGEAGKLANCEVKIGNASDTAAADVEEELKKFQTRLLQAVDMLDNAYYRFGCMDPCRMGKNPPFREWQWPDGSPLGQFDLMRYRIPPVVTLRPRPDGDYAEAAMAEMQGDRKLTAAVFRKMLWSAVSTTNQPSRSLGRAKRNPTYQTSNIVRFHLIIYRAEMQDGTKWNAERSSAIEPNFPLRRSSFDH